MRFRLKTLLASFVVASSILAVIADDWRSASHEQQIGNELGCVSKPAFGSLLQKFGTAPSWWAKRPTSCTLDAGGDQNVDRLLELPSLYSVELMSSDFTDDCCTILSRLPNLQRVNLGATSITDKGISEIGRSKSLVHIATPHDMTDIGLEKLALLQTLKSLDARVSVVSGEGVARFSGSRTDVIVNY